MAGHSLPHTPGYDTTPSNMKTTYVVALRVTLRCNITFARCPWWLFRVTATFVPSHTHHTFPVGVIATAAHTQLAALANLEHLWPLPTRWAWRQPHCPTVSNLPRRQLLTCRFALQCHTWP